MARIGLLILMVGSLALCGLGMSVSRTATVSLSIPALSVLAIPERNLFGNAVVVELSPEDMAQVALLIPLEVKSNVPWAVTARLLSEEGAELHVEVLGGLEVVVNTEEVPILSGRPGKHEVLLRVKLGNTTSAEAGQGLVLKITGLESGARRG